MPIYIAGPMTGLPDHNIQAFAVAAKRLRRAGLEVVNPAEIDHGVDPAWSDCMRRDIPELLKCDSIYLLLGWHMSEGASLEYHIARKLGMRIEFEAL